MLTRTNIDYKRSRIVRVFVTFNNTNTSNGTGFFINSQGLLLTCAHVILGEEFKFVKQNREFLDAQGLNNIEKAMSYHKKLTNNIKIKLDSGIIRNVSLIKINPEYDIALLKVNTDRFICEYFEIDSVIEPYYGEEISFYGYPSVLGHTYLDSPFVVNKSIISTYPEVEIGGNKYRHMQINATTIGGISGGPIFAGDNNKVVGIINGNFHWLFDNIVHREQNGDIVGSTKVPLGIGYSTSMYLINEKTDMFSTI